jgi:hypothetical protein
VLVIQGFSIQNGGNFGLKIGEGGRWLEWPGEIDICADALWYQAHPDVKIEELEFIQEIGHTSTERQQ